MAPGKWYHVTIGLSRRVEERMQHRANGAAGPAADLNLCLAPGEGRDLDWYLAGGRHLLILWRWRQQIGGGKSWLGPHR